MNSETTGLEQPVPPSRSSFWVLVILTVGAAVGFSFWLRARNTSNVGGLDVGKPTPPLVASGWIQGEPPSAESLDGEVLVVHAWSPECVHCFREAPELIELQRKYQDRVKFIGLTFRDVDRIEAIRGFLETTGIDWLNGYGALDTLRGFEAEYLPTVWVVGRDGTVVWNKDESASLEDGIERALAQK
ncbi:TlpA family protein disulfide reductase [Thalassoroseus pseudoceratinae]|uniref:TlpA family protein disulfide reductase n=1 Tax=Thalassoroseus pseudoceratinae TaxID=2713176 RepID=UPI00141EE529|nr:TlpA disulfide reductase family protein [Thalassoroseus pseudoceratinae]